MSTLPKTREEWQGALNSLPDTAKNGGEIPAFFFAHGSPVLAWERKWGISPQMMDMWKVSGHESPHALFLQDFGRVLLQQYKPRAILVFSAHWETSGTRLVTDYGNQNPLLFDYFGFPSELYQLKFKSHGDSQVTDQIVSALKKAGYNARASPVTESRGDDGRGFEGPGLDHGVFLPFRHMFGEETDVPIVQASIDSNLSSESEWRLGEAVEALRSDGILILSGGLTIHNLRDFSSFVESSAAPPYHAWDKAVDDAIAFQSPRERKKALIDLAAHPVYRLAHPRAEHFVPLYIAAGAGENGKSKVLLALFGLKAVAFGLE
ncbi:Extradiol aromatic ring-opening dioxygenase [Dacryopinax primogenitus]|uniref:Extradiol aromatic ring-opening dioxygenase n=1 Tax=Dacryopinax primogenitus (strain DJM 731) TaxID=1858805 RepID=M5GB17_DACPD|nr:Extradiol aromatic ring-opening dioxygenase [Dacryopinax primogenitus]EJU06114.1 Extradiol aromatic ring-opening dioxygenase [Dacryopinax primogenitus]